MATATISRISQEAEKFSLQEVEELEKILLARHAKLLFGEQNAEQKLLAQINAITFPLEKKQRLEELSRLSFAEKLPDELRPELLQLCEESARLDVERLEFALQLAALRGVPLRQIVQQLGLSAAP